MPHIVVSATASARLSAAREWLSRQAPDKPLVIIAPERAGAAELIRATVERTVAVLGWRTLTLPQVARELAATLMAGRGLASAGRLAAKAVVTRVVFERRRAGALGELAELEATPGFVTAVARSLSDLRLAGVRPEDIGPVDPRLAGLLSAFEEGLDQAGLLDYAGVLQLALEGLSSDEAPALVDVPLLVLDQPIGSPLEEELMAALARRAPDMLATIPAGDDLGCTRISRALAAVPLEPPTPKEVPRAVLRLQQHLFASAENLDGAADGGSVALFSAPGEARECVEIARRIHALAALGVPFDKMAVLLRSVTEYRPHVEEAFRRASIPAYFHSGVVRPDPAGRAFLALVRCALESLSARRFAEYLSLGEAPADFDAPPEVEASGPPLWSPPDDELAPAALDEVYANLEPGAPTPTGYLAVPRRWERLLVEAAVVGGFDRWRRRLAGLKAELELDLAALAHGPAGDDPDDPAMDRLSRALADLDRLQAFALPLLEELDALPAEAPWQAHLDSLSRLATRSLRSPERVLSVLSALAPMGSVGPVRLADVWRVLAESLRNLTLPTRGSRYGRVFVGPAASARGQSFQVVFVPGLAEKLFPRKISEDPILLDRTRIQLSPHLTTSTQRVDEERLALRLAVGAAEQEVVLSYPRLDAEKSRPRVPSFYALETVRAVEGSLPSVEQLTRRAETVGDSRIGWPAPRLPADAIDAAEFDLAILDGILKLPQHARTGRARYLLTANPTLARALRQRGYRWLRRWTDRDGLVEPTLSRSALANHQLAARSFSPTALETYAVCPYRFYLYAIQRLSPKADAVAIEEMDPLQRGALVHDVQFRLLSRLQESHRLPVGLEDLPAARDDLDEVLNEVAENYRERLAPAIEGVWRDGVEAIRADLREWLRRLAQDESGFVPWRFELSFGLGSQRSRDRHSVWDAVNLDQGLQLRGSIDLVERSPEGELRITDHKTGRPRHDQGTVVGGGRALQPVLYALAAEKLFAPDRVVGGRLSYCTANGRFETRDVALDATARDAALAVTTAIGVALAEGFFPAAPLEGACSWCDYRPICGSEEERRVRIKPSQRLAPLREVRRLP